MDLDTDDYDDDSDDDDEDVPVNIKYTLLYSINLEFVIINCIYANTIHWLWGYKIVLKHKIITK